MTEIDSKISRRSTMRFTRHALCGSAAVMATAYLRMRLHVNFSTTGFLHLLIVVLVATMSGFWEATVTSLVALTGLNYFLVPPRIHTLYRRPSELGRIDRLRIYRSAGEPWIRT
jgi:K+-sensing histidine kinase KdpD